jgi:hypothetical protein
VPEPSARRLLDLPVLDAPSARAASLASSAASHNAAGLLRFGRLDPHGIPPGIPPALDGGAHRSPLAGVAAGHVPFGGPVGRKNRGRLAPLGGVERPRRKERFARLIDRRVRAFWQAFGPRRLRRQTQPALDAAQVVRHDQDCTAAAGVSIATGEVGATQLWLGRQAPRWRRASCDVVQSRASPARPAADAGGQPRQNASPATQASASREIA